MDELKDVVQAAARSRSPHAALGKLTEDRDGLTLLRALASLQDGQFATAQARVLKVSRHSLARFHRQAHLVDLQRGVWRFTGSPGSPDPAITAWLSCWPLAVVSHASAACRHGLGDPPPLPHLTVPHDTPRFPARAVVHRTRSIPACDRLWIGAVAYTGVARTVCDLADPADPVGSLVRVDNAVAGGAKRTWIHRRAAALAPGRAGVALVRDATSATGAAEFRSWLERVTSYLFALAGLPQPEWNSPVRDRRGRIGLADLRWGKVIGELEGLRFHTTPAQRRRDAERFNRLLNAGFVVRRFTWHDVVERPLYVVRTLAEALVAAGFELDLAALPEHIELPAELLRFNLGR